jgi:hypothetical protein
MMKTKCLLAVGGLSCPVTVIDSAFVQATAFTYPGKLSAGGVAANSHYDLQFTIPDVTNSPQSTCRIPSP